MSNESQNPSNPGSAPGNPDIVEAGRATRFVPGRSGNPSGRPSTRVLTEELKKGLASPIPDALASELGLPPGSTFAEAITARLIRLAAAGEMPAIREVYERTEGKPPKEVVLEKAQPVGIHVVWEEIPPPAQVRSLRNQLADLASKTNHEEIKRMATELETRLTQIVKELEAEKPLGQIASSVSVGTEEKVLGD
jgi:uncharacterized protein DUF5681